MPTKKLILLCDDQQRFIDQFLERHGGYYDVEVVHDTRDIFTRIPQLPRLPDIVLVDLYHPVDETTPDFDERRLAAEASLSELDRQIERTNQAVLNVWEPHGIEVLRMLRETYSAKELPVAIYTQKGNILLADEELRKVEEYEGEWLLKKKLSARTEKLRIDRLIDGDKDKRHSANVFLIHGHDHENLDKLRKLLISFKLNPIVLVDIAGRGRTIIRKLEEEAADCGFAFALLTPDDFVQPRGDLAEHRVAQARPNVLFEIGWFYGWLGRERVCLISRRGTEMPSDLHGISRVEFTNEVDECAIELETELRAADVI